MHAFKTTLFNNSNIGLYGFATDSYCLIGTNIKKEKILAIKKTLKVPVYQLTIAETNLIGALATGNNNLILLPEIIEDEELKEIEKLNIKYKILKTKFTALGNNIIMNDNAALINPEFEDEVVEELKGLGLKVIKKRFLNIDSIGSLAALNQKGCLLHRDLSEKDLHFITSFLHLPADIGTINMGSPYIHSGIIPNSKGYIIGEETSGPEIMRLEQTLGFV